MLSFITVTIPANVTVPVNFGRRSARWYVWVAGQGAGIGLLPSDLRRAVYKD